MQDWHQPATMRPSPPQMTVTVGHDNGCLVIEAKGEIDLTSGNYLFEFLRTALDQSRTVILDMEGVSFIDSSGLHALISAQHYAEVQLGLLTVRNPSAKVSKVLDMSGVSQLLTVQSNGAPP